ncbi:TraX family protein [Neisseriaceae bacterium TC5R-5]|nr:TraX family protein [Neisseriaceae bacterium TC5R-5]
MKTPEGFRVSDGTIEALKWLALVLMTLDHINKHLFAEKLPGVFEMGRIAMPLFAFVLTYNLARPSTLSNGTYIRTMKRLALFSAIATPFFIGFGGLAFGWWPLNIMFMLLVATAILYLVEQGGAAYILTAVLVFLVGGAFVEFWWFALAFCICSWWYCKTNSKAALVACLLAAASLYVVNRNFWALAAMPLILVAPLLDIRIPRFRYLFYAYYPAHLAVLLLLKQCRH